MTPTLSLLLPFLAGMVLTGGDQVPKLRQREERTEALSRVALNSQEDLGNRDRALSALAAGDFKQATEIARRLVNEPSRMLRVRAAWILADGDEPEGHEVLRMMARERTGESVIAIQMLGRLKDPGSQALLSRLLRDELAAPHAPEAAGRISALTRALGDYADKRDAVLLTEAVKNRYSSGDWVMVEAAGRAGGLEAVPTLHDIFAKARGWTAMAAGLGLGRSGSPKGLKYVRERLADYSGDPSNPNYARMTNAASDDPYGPKAADFIRKHLGTPADQVFVHDLLQITTKPEFSWAAKAQAWQALSRINPPRERKVILDLAARNLMYTGAVRLLVLHEEPQAHARLVQMERSTDPSERALSEELRRALATSPRERRRWREVEGYPL